MKLKLVALSMSVLGLISCPGLAAAHTKHHKHHVKKQQMTTATTAADYKGMVPVVCPITDQYTMILDAMDQNIGRAKPTEDCMKLISFAGGMNMDAAWGNRGMGYTGENVQRISVNDAYLNMFGNVNDWTKAFATLSYDDASNTAGNTPTANTNQQTRLGGTYDQAYASNSLIMQQAFVRFSNFDETPFFFQVGKQFQNFGRYTINPIQRTLAQTLSETLQTSAELGFVTRMGFNGSIFAFDNDLRQRYNSALASGIEGHTQPNYGASLSFDQPSDQLGYDLGIGYLYDMTGVNDVAYAVQTYNTNANGGTFAGYDHHVGAGTIYGDIYTGGFSLSARYVSAFQSFNVFDLQSKGPSAVAAGTGTGAKPKAGDLTAGYGFNGWGKTQNVYVGYQGSSNAVNIFLPKNRWLIGYNVDMWKNTNLGAQIGHDIDYAVGQGGTGNSSNTINVRAAVKFG